mgnify:CR=1 FL=1
MIDQDKVIVVNVNDLLPTADELLKFALVFKNKDHLVKVVGDETSEQRIEEFNQQCNAYDIDADALYNALFVSFVLYASQQEVTLEATENNVLTSQDKPLTKGSETSNIHPNKDEG